MPVTVHVHAFTPANYVVDSTGDGGDSDVSDLLCDDGTGHCTLRAAIEQANLAPGANTISFAIPGSGVQTIAPASALPTISDPVTIDGTTQPGYAGQPLVELNGGSTGDGTEGLTINAGDSTVRGLVIDGFRSWAMHLLANGGDTIAGNYVGTTPDGMSVGGSVQHPTAGIFVDGVDNNTIGGTAGTTPGSACAGDCNLISPGNMSGSHEGVRIAGAGATNNVVEGNFIGTNRLGQDWGRTSRAPSRASPSPARATRPSAARPSPPGTCSPTSPSTACCSTARRTRRSRATGSASTPPARTRCRSPRRRSARQQLARHRHRRAHERPRHGARQRDRRHAE